MPDLIPMLQTAIGPVILISGVGLLLLTMTNRLGRVIDRARIIASALHGAAPETRPPLEAQLRILWRRAGLIRTAIALASTSALAAALLVVLLFLAALSGITAVWLVTALFVACLSSLILSLVFFIRDIDQSLTALKLELGTYLDGEV